MRKLIRPLSCALAVILAASLAACTKAPATGIESPLDSTTPTTSSAPSDNARAAVVDDFAGDVVATSDGDELSAFRGLALLRRDSLGTGAESWSSLELAEGQFVMIEENSEVSIAQLTDDVKSAEINVVGGKIWVSIANKLADDESFEVRTPTCALSVRGTVFAVTFDENTCQVAVYDGTVLLHAEDERGAPILDENGNEVVLEISGDKAVVTAENGVITQALQSELTEEDWAPLYVQGDDGPGGMFDILRSRLPELVWDADSSPFANYATAYKQVLLDNKDAILGVGPGWRLDFLFEDGNINVADINGDGIPELLFTLMSEPNPMAPDIQAADLHIYGYAGGSAIRIFDMEYVRVIADGDPQVEVLLSPDGTVMTSATGDTIHSDQGNVYTTYEFDSSGMLVAQDSITIRGYHYWEQDLENLVYYRNDEVISESEYNGLLAAYTNSDNEIVLFSNQYYWDDNLGSLTKPFIMSFDQAIDYLDSLGS